MSVASAVITGIGQIWATKYSGDRQEEILKEGEAASKEQYLGELSESRRRFKTEEQLKRKEMAESRRQFDKSYSLSREKLDWEEGQVARNVFRDQFKNLTGYLDKDEALKNLYINRLNGLRN